ncbi:hypothetical protein NL676_035395 [Syzygium grande]|nr:hypothetical protein NL676_035395 [Syzygium grande]
MIGGCEMVLLIEKPLGIVDVSPPARWLMLPKAQLQAKFLRKAEKEALKTRDENGASMKMKVLLLGPSGETCPSCLIRLDGVPLGRARMGRHRGKERIEKGSSRPAVSVLDRVESLFRTRKPLTRRPGGAEQSRLESRLSKADSVIPGDIVVYTSVVGDKGARMEHTIKSNGDSADGKMGGELRGEGREEREEK